MRTQQFRRTKIAGVLILCILLCSFPAAAQLSQNMQDVLRRINSPEFNGGGGGRGGAGGRWVDGGQGYTDTERNANVGSEIVRYDTTTGKRLLFTSERDGWRHAYAVSREGSARLIHNRTF